MLTRVPTEGIGSRLDLFELVLDFRQPLDQVNRHGDSHLERVWLRWSDRSGGLGDGPPCETRLVNTPVLLCQVVLPVRGPVAVRAHCS